MIKSLSLSLSLSHTHTHTHTQAKTRPARIDFPPFGSRKGETSGGKSKNGGEGEGGKWRKYKEGGEGRGGRRRRR